MRGRAVLALARKLAAVLPALAGLGLLATVMVVLIGLMVVIAGIAAMSVVGMVW